MSRATVDRVLLWAMSLISLVALTIFVLSLMGRLPRHFSMDVASPLVILAVVINLVRSRAGRQRREPPH